MATLPGRLVMAQHLRHDLRAVDAVEIMLRYEPGNQRVAGEYVIYLDGREAARVAPQWEKRDGISSLAHGAYDRMDEIAGYKLADHRGPDLEASMGR